MRQGRFRPKNPDKYKGNPQNIVYRSGWELKVMHYLDRNPSVLKWASEEFAIPYMHPVDGKLHRYFPDFWVRFKARDGSTKDVILEVKPKKFTAEPKARKKMTPRYIQEVVTWKINEAKWQAATDFGKKHGVEFRLVTETELGIDK